MAVAEALAPQPGERVLDLAAAPGGKTTHLAALMQGKGLLIANEIHPQRVWSLCENLERWGVRNAVVTQETPSRLSHHFEGFFDRVLLDAPCSGEGMFRKSEAARLDWSLDIVARNALRQLDILQHASRMVRPGGILGYSTCTFAPEENEGVIAKFLSQTEAGKFFSLDTIHQQITGGSKGKPHWLVDMDVKNLNLERSVRLWPHHHAPEGHYIAILRNNSKTNSDKQPKYQPYRYNTEAMKLFDEFCANTLTLRRDEGYFLEQQLTVEGSYLYALPESLPDLRGLKVIHPGWWLGELKNKRFEPSHAMALGLNENYFNRTMNLSVDHPHIKAYLSGESFPTNCEAGWTVITIQRQNDSRKFPLGWGKSSQGILKNAYPKGLRWK
jgi:NOL1/NOP2/fmu family ribosome biogenesis protein